MVSFDSIKYGGAHVSAVDGHKTIEEAKIIKIIEMMKVQTRGRFRHFTGQLEFFPSYKGGGFIIVGLGGEGFASLCHKVLQ